jgi:hypothetical protein
MTVLAHLPVAGTFGIGTKCPDWQGAWLCHSCHTYIDGEGRNDWKCRFTALRNQIDRMLRRGYLRLDR